MLSNSQITDLFSLMADLLELHNENEFKIKAYNIAVFRLEKVEENLYEMPPEALKKIVGIGKSTTEKIIEIQRKNTFEELENLLANTPKGLLEILKVRGLGAKKVRLLWQELQITTPTELLQACETGKVAQLKGFGEKTQDAIKHGLIFIDAASEKLLFIDAEPLANALLEYLQIALPDTKISLAGEVRRHLEIVETIELVVGTGKNETLINALNAYELLENDPQKSGIFTWRGHFKENATKVTVHVCPADRFENTLFLYSADISHLAFASNGHTLLQKATTQNYASENALYESMQLPFVPAEMREGTFAFQVLKENPDLKLLETSDLKGVLHNHSTYSDGKHSLREMALEAQRLGYEYLGITDHSQSAVYAGGLSLAKVLEQHQEIELLNQAFLGQHFKIFKGIESDILPDGSLDYPETMLKNFDFVIASVHSAMQMAEAKATERLIKAIENPYTTILGHPTGRLLLRREGYPLNMPKILDACASNGVSIEINAHPVRLDLDWRWVHTALEKGIKIAICPDAHAKEGYRYVRYGVLAGRKGGLTAQMCLNAMGLDEVNNFFRNKVKMSSVGT